MMKYRMKLRQHEFDTLLVIFEKVVLPDIKEVNSMQDKVAAVLLLQMYESLRKADGLFKKDVYTINIPAASAMTFHMYWRETPIAGVMTSSLINRLIGEIDQQFA